LRCRNKRTRSLELRYDDEEADRDRKELHGLYDELADSIRPQGRIEEMLVEKLAHTYLRLQRCARAEAEHHIRTWEVPYDDDFRLRRYADRKNWRATSVLTRSRNPSSSSPATTRR